MNIKKLYLAMSIVGLYSSNVTAMLAQIARHKTSIESLSTLVCHKQEDHTSRTHTILSRMPQQHSSAYSSSSAAFTKQSTPKEIQLLLELNAYDISYTNKYIKQAGDYGVGGCTIMSVGTAGYYGFPHLASILKDAHPLFSLSENLLSAVGTHGCPIIFTIGAAIACTSTFSLGLHSSRFAYLKCREKYLATLVAQAAEESQNNSRIDMPEDKN